MPRKSPVHGAPIYTPVSTGGGTVESVTAGTGISVDNTDPANPIVSSTVTAPDADATTKGIVKLANDFGGTAALPTVVATHLASALPVNQGGSGATTLTGILKGNGTSAFTAVTAPSGTILGTTDTQTLTNKRITKRSGSTTSSSTPTINTDNYDIYGLTAQTTDITSFTTNLSGTPTEGQTLWIWIVGTATRAITWGSSFEASTVLLPTTTTGTNRLDVGFVWNSATSKWRCVATS